MSFNIIYTPEARLDLRNITEYISYKLLAPDTAKRQIARIMTEIQGLSELPDRHKIYDGEPWKSQGMRFFPVDNYLVFYITNAQTKTVHILRIMYGGRDISSRLNEDK